VTAGTELIATAIYDPVWCTVNVKTQLARLIHPLTRMVLTPSPCPRRFAKI